LLLNAGGVSSWGQSYFAFTWACLYWWAVLAYYRFCIDAVGVTSVCFARFDGVRLSLLLDILCSKNNDNKLSLTPVVLN
jgi:hypothetical protein